MEYNGWKQKAEWKHNGFRVGRRVRRAGGLFCRCLQNLVAVLHALHLKVAADLRAAVAAAVPSRNGMKRPREKRGRLCMRIG